MHVVYEKLAIIDEYLVHHCWEYRAVNIPTVCVLSCRPSTRDTQMPLYHASVLSLSQVILQKCSKMQHIFAYNGLPGGLLPHDLHFYIARVKLVLSSN